MPKIKPIDGTDIYLWKYLPSLWAAAALLAGFAITSTIIFFRTIKSRAWFCIPFLLGGLFQIIGYTVRIISRYHTNSIGLYAIQLCFIILAPIFYAASIYMTLSRLIRSLHGERFSIIRPTWLTKIFVLGDIISLSVQGNGSGMLVKAKTQKAGEITITAGLFIQLILFGFFCIVALIFHRRFEKGVPKDSDQRIGVPWKKGLWMLYACSVLIMARSIFRVAEYIGGSDGYLLRHEWAAYTFDAIFMFLVQLILAVWFPGAFNTVKNGTALHTSG